MLENTAAAVRRLRSEAHGRSGVYNDRIVEKRGVQKKCWLVSGFGCGEPRSFRGDASGEDLKQAERHGVKTSEGPQSFTARCSQGHSKVAGVPGSDVEVHGIANRPDPQVLEGDHGGHS